MKSDKMAYIGRADCGCVVACMVDRLTDRKGLAKEIASWIRMGLTVEHVTVDYANEHFTWECSHKPEKAQLSLFGEEAL